MEGAQFLGAAVEEETVVEVEAEAGHSSLVEAAAAAGHPTVAEGGVEGPPFSAVGFGG